jgi:hypothetical protein
MPILSQKEEEEDPMLKDIDSMKVILPNFPSQEE